MIMEKPEGVTHVDFYKTGNYDMFKIIQDSEMLGRYSVYLWNGSGWLDYTNVCDVDELRHLLENCEV